MTSPAEKKDGSFDNAPDTRARSVARAMRYLKASCHGGGIPMVLRAKGDPIAFDPKISLTDAVGLSLVAPDGKSLGCVKEATRENAQSIIDGVGQEPSNIMRTADDRIALVWLFTTSQAAEKVSPTLRLFTGYDVDGQFVPLPDCSADYAYPEDEPAPDASFVAYDADDLLQRMVAFADASVKFDPTRWPNVELIGGDIDPEVLRIPMTIAIPRHREDKRIKNWNATFGEFLDKLADHKVGPKDGLSFLQGELNIANAKIGGPRPKGAMKRMFFAALDLDNGEPIDPKIDKSRELGLAMVAYTSASHGSTESTFLVTSMWQYAEKNGLRLDAPEDTIRHFVTHEKHWDPGIIETIRFVKERHDPKDTEGPVYVIAHDRMPKYRLVYPLSKPAELSSPGKNPKDLQKLWGQKLLALAAMIGARPDPACLDVSRLFYIGRHKEGAPFRVIVVNGKPLDYDAIEIPTDEKIATDHFAAAGRDMGAGNSGSKGTGTFKDSAVEGFSFRKLATLRGHRIDFTRLLIDKCPDRIRHEISQDQIEIECPFDGAHSNAGNPDDRACCVWNSDPSQRKGFSISCRHASCQPGGKDRDRLDFVCEMVTSGWLTTDDLENDEYILDLNKGEKIPSAKGVDKNALARDIIERVKAAGPRTACRTVLEPLLWEAVNAEVGTYNIGCVMDAMKESKDFPPKRQQDWVKHTQRQMQRRTAEETAQAAKEAGIVVISTGDNHEAQCDKALAALRAYHVKAQGVFNAGGGLVRIKNEPRTGIPVTQALTERNLPNTMRKADIRFFDEKQERNVSTPADVVKDLLAETDNGFPDLTGIVHTPFFALGQDGKATRVETPKYHAASGYYYAANAKLVVPPVPENPTPDDTTRAKWLLLKDVFGQFPFEGDADKAHLLCMLLQFFMRELIDGPTPIYTISKPMAGTGAGKLFNCVALIATGDIGHSHTNPYDDTERSKTMLSVLGKGDPYFWIDNILHEVHSDVYATCATSGVYAGRLLGGNEDAKYPIRFVWVMSGNHLKFSHEMTRRTAPIFLDAKGDPLKREDFRHADLEGYVRQHRAELVWACLTLVQAWVAKGMPQRPQKPRKSFESWSAVFRGLLETIGVEGFLENIRRADEEANEEKAAWNAFVSAFAEQGLGAKYARKVGNPDDHTNPHRPEWHGDNSLVLLAEQCELKIGGKNGPGRATSLGKLLKTKDRNVFDATVAGMKIEVMLHSVEDARSGGRLYYPDKHVDEASGGQIVSD